MKLVYIAAIRFPTEKAHGLAIAKQCEAFVAQGHTVRLVYSRRTQVSQLQETAWQAFYGIKHVFKLTSLWCLDLLHWNARLPHSVQAANFLLLLLTFYLSLLFYLLKKSVPLIYTREVMVAMIAWGLGKEVVLEVHNWTHQRWLGRWYQFLLPRLKGIVVISSALYDCCLGIGVSPARLVLLPSGVSTDFFVTTSKRQARISLGLTQNRFIISYVGSLSAHKGIHLLMQVAQLLQAQTHLRLLIVGGNYVDSSQQVWGRKLKKLPNIILVGHQPNHRIPLYLAASDMLLLPNSAERSKVFSRYTSPMKFFEYMASGRPIIAAQISALKTIVYDKKEVLFFKPDDAQDLAEKIIQLSKDPNMRLQLGKNARRLARKFTWEKRAEAIAQFVATLP